VRRKLSVPAIMLAVVVSFPAYASIRLHVADSAALHEALGKPPSELWYRKAAYEAIRDGTVDLVDPSKTYWVDSINAGIATNAYARILDTSVTRPENAYLVVGVAEEFTVPSTGEYTFEMKGDDALFVVIDGELLTDDEGKAFLYDGLDDPLDMARGDGGEPEVKVGMFGMGPGYTSTVTLEEGSHTFEFYYYEGKGQTVSSLYWTPAGGEKSVVPASVFGERKNAGPLKIATKNWDVCPYDIYKQECPHELHIDVQVLSGVLPGETEPVYFVWDFYTENEAGKGVIDIRTTETFIETTVVCEHADQLINFEVWGELGDKRSPIAEGGSCNVLYCHLDQCNPALQGTDPAAYEECAAAPTGDCGGNAGVIPRRFGAQRLSEINGKDQYSVYSVDGRKLTGAALSSLEKGITSNAVYIVRYHGRRGPEKLIRVLH